MATLNYRQTIRTHRYSRWGVASIWASLSGFVLTVLALVALHPTLGATDYRPLFILFYLGCLVFGFVSSAIGYFRDERQKLFCCFAFMVSLFPVLLMLGITLLVALLSKN